MDGVADSHPLCGSLVCRCGQFCYSVSSVDGSRAYGGACGCRLQPIDAATVERLVHDAAERENPTLLAGIPIEDCWPLVPTVFAQVVVAGHADELSFVRRV
ncbi:MAG TPA: hypothetical protein VGD43_02710 [Micromonospora sp.]